MPLFAEYLPAGISNACVSHKGPPESQLLNDTRHCNALPLAMILAKQSSQGYVNGYLLAEIETGFGCGMNDMRLYCCYNGECWLCWNEFGSDKNDYRMSSIASGSFMHRISVGCSTGPTSMKDGRMSEMQQGLQCRPQKISALVRARS